MGKASKKVQKRVVIKEIKVERIVTKRNKVREEILIVA
jgi:hypothetical protein